VGHIEDSHDELQERGFRIVIASRPMEDLATLTERLPLLRVQPLDQSTQAAIVSRWLGEKDSGAFSKATGSMGPGDVYSNPLTLTMSIQAYLAGGFEATGNAIKTRPELYRTFLGAWENEWRHRSGGADLPRPLRASTRALLRELALESLLSEVEERSMDADHCLREAMVRLLKVSYAEAEGYAAEFLQFMGIHGGVFSVGVEHDRLDWYHATVREFLAGEAAGNLGVQSAEFQLLAQRWDEPGCQEALLFAMSGMDDSATVESQVRRILREERKGIIFAASLVREGARISEALLAEIASDLRRQTEKDIELGRCAMMFSGFEDRVDPFDLLVSLVKFPEFESELRSVLELEEVDSERREYACRALRGNSDRARGGS
jgi:hypothetical protein